MLLIKKLAVSLLRGHVSSTVHVDVIVEPFILFQGLDARSLYGCGGFYRFITRGAAFGSVGEASI
jgi:hypothetical protein